MGKQTIYKWAILAMLNNQRVGQTTSWIVPPLKSLELDRWYERWYQWTQNGDVESSHTLSYPITVNSEGQGHQTSPMILLATRNWKWELEPHPNLRNYPLAMTNSLLLKMAIEIVDMVIFHSFLYVYQAG